MVPNKPHDPVGGAVLRPQEPPARRVADLRHGPQAELARIDRLAERLQRANANRRDAAADRERIKDQIEAATGAVGRALSLLDTSGAWVQRQPPGSDAPGEAATDIDPNEILRGGIRRFGRRIGALSEQVRDLRLAHELNETQLSHLRSQLARLRDGGHLLEQEAARLAQANEQLRAQNRRAKRQVAGLSSRIGRWHDEQFWSLCLFFSRAAGFAAYADQVDHDPRRLFTFLLLSEVRARTDVDDAMKEHARAIADLFDPVYYLSEYRDVGLAGHNPLLDYVATGWQKGRRPNLLFDPDYYHSEAGAVAGDPLLDYATKGVFAGKKPHPLFDGAFYWQQYPDIAEAQLNPLFHYQGWGGRERRRPSPLFDTGYFLEAYDLPVASDNPLEDYLRQGGDWAAAPHPLFSASFFAAQAGIARFAEAPLALYQKRPDLWATAPHPLFDPGYLRDVLASRGIELPESMSPLEYFCRAEADADIDTHTLFDSRLYRYQVERERERVLAEPPVIDYLKQGWRDKSLLPNVLFDPQTYRERNRIESDGPELVHYCLEGDRAGFWCHPVFCAQTYNSNRTDGEPVTALEHFLLAGPEAARISHPHFDRPLEREPLEFVGAVIGSRGEVDPGFYRAANPDLGALSDAEAAAHFTVDGCREGRFASPRQLVEALQLRVRDIPLGFSKEAYLRFNPDLAVLGDDFRALFRHYLAEGRAENRRIGHWQFHLSGMPLPELRAPAERAAVDGEQAVVEVGLLIHVFYDDLWRELAGFAQNFETVKRDVFINVVDAAWTPRLHREIRELCPGAFIQLSNDNGRDIGGFMRLLDNVDFAHYELFALMHTKKSPHVAPEQAAHWRRALLGAFAGSRQTVEECVGLFRQDPGIGLIGCADYRETSLDNNTARYEALLDQFEIEPQHRAPEYLSGTMFMIRAPILRRLHEKLKDADWEYGGDKDVEFHRDGQIAHGVERAIGNLVRQMGYRILWRRPEGEP